MLRGRQKSEEAIEGEKQSTTIVAFHVRSSKEISADHLQAVSRDLSVPDISAVSMARSITGNWLLYASIHLSIGWFE